MSTSSTNRHNPGKLMHLAVPALLALMIAGCGGDNGSGSTGASALNSTSINMTASDDATCFTAEYAAENTTVNPPAHSSEEIDVAAGNLLHAFSIPVVTSAGPVMVDPQGVFVYAVKAAPGAVYASYIQTGSPYLMLARSEDNGTTWRKSIIDYGGIYASLDVDGDNVFVSYIDQSWNTLKFARSGDRGTTWSIEEVDVTLKSDPATRPTITDPSTPNLPDGFKYTAMARSGNSFFIAYQDRAHNSLRLARSDNGGASWVCTTLDDSHDADGDSPSIAIDGTNIYISYTGVTGQGFSAKDSVYMMVSRNTGATWTRCVVAAAAYASGYYTSVAASGPRVYVSYFNAQDRTLKVAKSGNYGSSWAIAKVDAKNNVGRYSSLTVAQGVLYLSYSDWANNSLKVAKSSNWGLTWTIKTVAADAGLGCPSTATVLGSELSVFYFHYAPAQPGSTGAVLTKVT
jgi:hypothetical protein